MKKLSFILIIAVICLMACEKEKNPEYSIRWDNQRADTIDVIIQGKYGAYAITIYPGDTIGKDYDYNKPYTVYANCGKSVIATGKVTYLNIIK